MESEYLLDTNILIYYTKGSESARHLIDDLTLRHTLNISILTKIEFLGWDKHTAEGYETCKELIEYATIYPLDKNVSDKAIELKRSSKIKLADAVIAATALVNDLKLVTKNIDDFAKIEGLEVVNILE
ncbi:MAG: type II toxin-antitoxin system VapC family toxin [Nitrospirae bacterium]|nr:MAG: type II toxin-antitoxin system VapC family toxin [Nitrospirota bacterium]